MTTIEYRNGDRKQVKGSIKEIVAYFESKGAKVQESRISDNLSVFINGMLVADIIK